MTVPAAGEFRVSETPTGIRLHCPTCGHGPEFDTPFDLHPNLRDLIAAASDHAQTHAREQVNA